MDREIVEKLKSIGISEQSADQSFTVSFSKTDENCITISLDNGNEVTHKLKSLNKLFLLNSSNALADINWENENYLLLLMTIETAIKKVYIANPNLLDSSVIIALENLFRDPAFINNDIVIKEINTSLRLHLSMNDYSRHEVKKAFQKILKSAQRHKKLSGMRGYLEFIKKYIP